MSDPMGQQEQRLAELLRMLRLRQRMKQRDLAKHIGVDHGTVGRIERGESSITLIVFMKWCDAVGEPSAKVLRFAETSVAKVPLERESPLISDILMK